jgi:hypothetical protein
LIVAAAVDADGQPDRPGEPICRPVLPAPRAIRSSSSSTSMTTSGPALSMAVMSAPPPQSVPAWSLIVMALVAVVGGHAAAGHHDPQQVHRFLEVGVAQEERAHDLFLVLAALGRRVGDDW